jgi:hypothetical protein
MKDQGIEGIKGMKRIEGMKGIKAMEAIEGVMEGSLHPFNLFYRFHPCDRTPQQGEAA